MGKPRTITGKARLDWILKRVIPYGDGVIERDPMPQFTHADEIASRRANIDAAIRSERKGDR